MQKYKKRGNMIDVINLNLMVVNHLIKSKFEIVHLLNIFVCIYCFRYFASLKVLKDIIKYGQMYKY